MYILYLGYQDAGDCMVVGLSLIIIIVSPIIVVYLEFLERTSNYLVMRRCDDCNSDAIDLSANPVPFGEYYHLVAHVSIY
jgi:hypothetical protein